MFTFKRALWGFRFQQGENPNTCYPSAFMPQEGAGGDFKGLITEWNAMYEYGEKIRCNQRIKVWILIDKLLICLIEHFPWFYGIWNEWIIALVFDYWLKLFKLAIWLFYAVISIERFKSTRKFYFSTLIYQFVGTFQSQLKIDEKLHVPSIGETRAKSHKSKTSKFYIFKNK